MSPNDLEPLIALRRKHQTVQATTGVRNYKRLNSSKLDDDKDSSDVESKLSQRQELAQQINSVIHYTEERGSSTGLNRTTRHKTDPKASDSNTPAPGGNSANAEVAAKGRAAEVNDADSCLS